MESEHNTLVVGLSASEGGIEALKLFFQSLPVDTGMAFIVVLHFDPKQKIILEDLLQLQTKLDVVEVTEETQIEQNKVYIVPDENEVTVKDGVLNVHDSTKKERIDEDLKIDFTEFTELKEIQKFIKEQRYQQALASLGVYALEQEELEAIMQRAINVSCILLELDCAVIFSADEDNGTLQISAQAGCAEKLDPVEISKKWDLGFALNNDKPVVVNTYEEEDRFSISPFMQDKSIISSLHIIIRGTDDTYGLFGFYASKQREFTEYEIHFIQIIANIVGMSIQQKKSKEKLKEEIKKSDFFQKEILNNNVAERWRIGEYLHDNLGQSLASLKIIVNEIKTKLLENGLDADEEITQINEIVDEGIAGIRDLTHDIIPVDIEEEGVEHAFLHLVRQAQKLHKINCRLDIDNISLQIKDRNLATHIYHIVHEAIKNAALRGEAENVTIYLKASNEDLMLKVRDDGIGMINSKKRSDGKGLRIMKHRMELLGGTFRIQDWEEDSKSGTDVLCFIPKKHLKDQEKSKESQEEEKPSASSNK